MGFEHVIPQFALRLKTVVSAHPSGKLPFKLQSDGSQARSFCHVDDLVSGVMAMRAKGEHLGIYHIGTDEEVPVARLAREIAAALGYEVKLHTSPAQVGGTLRRCPDITKVRALGYQPRTSLADGIAKTARWYASHQRP
jgi:nucleoside-diphosphate-sugar epimerase